MYVPTVSSPEKNFLETEPDCYDPYVYKTVSINGNQTRDLLNYINKKVKKGSWTLKENCAYFAATAWKKVGQLSLDYSSEMGFGDPAILYNSIVWSYRNYGKKGEGVIGPGITQSSSSI